MTENPEVQMFGQVTAGEETWSESAMVLYFDTALQNGFSLRISRYPDRNATWVWCHVLQDGALYSYTNAAIPCTTARIEPHSASAIYGAPGLQVHITRRGSSADLEGFAFAATLRARRGAGGEDGDGDVPVALAGSFRPGPLRPGSPAGRFERTGEIEAIIDIDGRRGAISGIGKAHEQTQTAPRFTVPFTYAMLWGPSAAMVALSANGRGRGICDVAGAEQQITEFAVAPWSEQRRFAATLADGRKLDGVARTVHHYRVPVFGQQWQGHVVAAEIGGERLVGMINDWRPEKQIYRLN
jgi:hypothetical protein